MNQILHGLYNGKIIPWERRNPQSVQQRELLRRIEDKQRYFMAKMSPDDCRRFQALSRLQMELSTAGEEHLFTYAFSLGMLLAREVAQEADSMLHDESASATTIEHTTLEHTTLGQG